MWKYEQISGRLYRDEELVGVGYSGAGAGKNNPDLQQIRDIGPIPCGAYSVGSPVDTVTHGPFVLPLTPNPANNMFGRTAFLIHGDSVVSPGTASQGCIIQSRDVREKVAASSEKVLTVVSGL